MRQTEIAYLGFAPCCFLDIFCDLLGDLAGGERVVASGMPGGAPIMNLMAAGSVAVPVAVWSSPASIFLANSQPLAEMLYLAGK